MSRTRTPHVRSASRTNTFSVDPKPQESLSQKNLLCGGFFADDISVNWFSKSPCVQVETVPPQTDETRLAEIERQCSLVRAERNEARHKVLLYMQRRMDPRIRFTGNGLLAVVGAMGMDPLRQALESEQRLLDQKYDALLQERADLMLKLKLIR
jgi:hypothetical protein